MAQINRKSKELHFGFWILGLAALNLPLFIDILWDGRNKVLSSQGTDIYLHFAAWRQFAFDQLRHGNLVLWNPHYLCGTPFLGNFESALLYPPNWLYLILPLGWAINLGIILHVFLAGLFTMLWTRNRGLHPLACFTSGVVFMWGGAFYLHLYAGHLPNLCTMVWAPLLFLSIDGMHIKITLRWLLVGIFAGSMQVFAGHPQYVYFTAIIACFYVLFNLVEVPSKLRFLGSFIAVYFGVFLVTAVQLWTGIEAFQECSRNAPLEFVKASSFSFPPQNILTLILPDFFGNLTTSRYWSQWFLWEVSIFIGMGGFFLAMIGMRPRCRTFRKWDIAAGSVAFVLSLGSFSPLYRFLYRFVPLFSGMRGMSKFDFLASLFLAMLCGIGLDSLIRDKKPPRGIWIITGVAGIIFLGLEIFILNSLDAGLAGAWGKWFSSIGWLKKSMAMMALSQKEAFLSEAGLQSSWSLLVGGCTCIFLTIIFSLRKLNLPAIYSIVGLVILELFIFARHNRPTFELSTLQAKYDQIKDIYRRDPGEYRVYGTGSASLVTDSYDLWEDEPMVLGRYGRFVCYSQGLSENQLFSVLPIFSRFSPVFSMTRLKYLISMEGTPHVSYVMPTPPLPRMLLLNKYRVYRDGDKMLPALFNRGFNPRRTVYLESPPEPAPEPGKIEGKVVWKDLSTDLVEVSVFNPKTSLLLITDNYSRGWRISPLPGDVQAHYQILPANYFLRAVPLSAGNHRFLMEYKPRVFIFGKWVSIFSCLLYVGALIFHLRKGRFAL